MRLHARKAVSACLDAKRGEVRSCISPAASIQPFTDTDMHLQLRSVAILLAVFGFVPVQAAQISGAVLASSCTSCHGAKELKPGTIPPLAALKPDAFVAKMKAFKSGDAKGTVMNRIAAGYSDTEFAALAGYFSGPGR
jgi:cytochrome subunit of sulfide dehydrogenase